MQKVTTRSASGVIERREDFTTSGALNGAWYASWWNVGTGYLPGEWAGKLREVAGPVYVVYSYATPIAWFLPTVGWTIPGVKYSVTTSKHQGNLYLVMAPGVHRGMSGIDLGLKNVTPCPATYSEHGVPLQCEERLGHDWPHYHQGLEWPVTA